MFCKNCGTQLPDDARFCPNCGSDFQPVTPNSSANTAPQFAQSAQPAVADNSGSILTFGILGLAFGCSFWLSLLGIIFGRIAMSKARLYQVSIGPLSGKARTGSILGKVGFILGIVFTSILAFYLFVLLIVSLSY